MNVETLRKQLVLHEGERLKPYEDTVGKITIGIGHNLTDLGISPAISDALYREDLTKVVAHLSQYLPWWRSLDDVRQRVLVDLCFNLGIGGLLTFKNTLKFAQAGQWASAAGCLRASHWYTQVNTRGPRLCTMLETGQDPSELA